MPTLVHKYIASRFLTRVGGEVGAAVGPLIAALTFQASPGQMGAITGTSMAISCALRLPAASYIDGIRDERVVMVRGGFIAIVVSAFVPLLWLAGALTFWSFLACVCLSSSISVVLGVAGFRMLNQLTDKGDRTQAVGWLNSADSAGSMIGQSSGGLLVTLIAPPLALLASPVMTFLGIIFLPQSNKDQLQPNSSSDTHCSRKEDPPQSRRSIVRTALMSQYMAIAITLGIAGSLIEPVVVIFLLRQANLPPSLLGISLGIGALGGVLGGVAVGPAVKRLGFWASFIVAVLLMLGGTVTLLMVALRPGWAFVAAIAFELTTAAGGTLAIAGAMGRLQESAAPSAIARTMSVATLAMETTGIAGIALGAAIAESFSTTTAMKLSIVVYAAALIAALVAMMRGSTPTRRSH